MSESRPSDDSHAVTALLHEIRAGDDAARSRLYRIVFGHLRQMAEAQLRGEQDAGLLQPTLLVNDAYLRVLGLNDIDWRDRSHLFGVAATAMRRILVDHARYRKRARRGGSQVVLPLQEARDVPGSGAAHPIDLLALDEALDALREFEPRQASVVEFRFFAGLSTKDIAFLLGVSLTTAKDDWDKARAFLRLQLDPD